MLCGLFTKTHFPPNHKVQMLTNKHEIRRQQGVRMASPVTGENKYYLWVSLINIIYFSNLYPGNVLYANNRPFVAFPIPHERRK